MNPLTLTTAILGWFVFMNLLVFSLFAIDKWQAKRNPVRRVSEFTLLSLSAIGGWPGGLLAMIFFRHKTAKLSFLLRFFAAFLVFVLLIGAWIKFAGLK